jgi:CRP/FNR family transcriptional regulator, cyclic AMP receptor protein
MPSTIDDLIAGADLVQGLGPDEVHSFSTIGVRQHLSKDEYLFVLGDRADRLYVVVEGGLKLCFPMSLGEMVQDVSVESVAPGRTVGWSALVKPYRFTLSARAAQPSQVVAFPRRDLLELFDAEPRTGYAVSTRISELVGVRLLAVLALWARSLQRTVAAEIARDAE